MAKISDQLRPGDATIWGVMTIAVWAVAILGANVSALIPESVFAGLHTTRLSGATLNQLRAQVATLETQSTVLKEQNRQLQDRFMLIDTESGEVTRRVGALELSIPKLLEAIPADDMIDRGTVTASVGGPATTFDAEGGSVSVRTTPLAGGAMPDQAIPDALAVIPDSNAYGVALGPPFDASEAEGVWQSLSTRAGSLLDGLAPLTANMEGMSGKRLVAGPLMGEKQANALCGRFAKAGIACSVVPFIGEPLPLLN
ncbi:MAG TPA: hypothetical protein VG757_03305 [Devosia sp.]|nr:hypothetical protein [Devosia sp.]